MVNLYLKFIASPKMPFTMFSWKKLKTFLYNTLQVSSGCWFWPELCANVTSLHLSCNRNTASWKLNVCSVSAKALAIRDVSNCAVIVTE